MIFFYGTEQQKEFITCEAETIALLCGRRFGKNFGWRYRALYQCLKNPEFQYTYVGKTYALAQAEWDFIANNIGVQPVSHYSFGGFDFTGKGCFNIDRIFKAFYPFKVQALNQV